MRHPVGFTDTAKQDVREFVTDPARRLELARAIINRLAVFPRAHQACPAFGPRARFYVEDRFTVIYDVAAGAEPEPVIVRHVWPSRGQLVAELLGAVKR